MSPMGLKASLADFAILLESLISILVATQNSSLVDYFCGCLLVPDTEDCVAMTALYVSPDQKTNKKTAGGQKVPHVRIQPSHSETGGRTQRKTRARRGKGYIACHPSSARARGSAKRRSPGSVNFVPAVANHFCLALPAAVTQPWTHLFADSCIKPSLPLSVMRVMNLALCGRDDPKSSGSLSDFLDSRLDHYGGPYLYDVCTV